MKIVQVADMHLRPYIWGLLKTAGSDSYLAWEMLCNSIYKRFKAPYAVVLCGDTFNTTTPPSDAEEAFKKGAKLIKDSGGLLYSIEGNHDKERIPRTTLFDCIDINEKLVEFPDGSTMYGISFIRDTDKLLEKISNAPPCTFLVLHSAFRHLLGFDGKWQLQNIDIPEYIENVLVGDIHVKDIHKHNGTTIFSPGALAVNSISEFDKHHGAFVLDTETREVDYIDIRTRVFMSVEIQKADAFILKAIADTGEGMFIPIINIVHTKVDTPVFEELSERYKNTAYLLSNIKSIENASKYAMGASTTLDCLDDVIVTAITEILDNDRDRAFAYDLIKAENPEEVIEEYLKE